MALLGKTGLTYLKKYLNYLHSLWEFIKRLCYKMRVLVLVYQKCTKIIIFCNSVEKMSLGQTGDWQAIAKYFVKKR